MRVLALIAATVGCLLVAVAGFGLHTTITSWDILGRSGALMGMLPDYWRSHWLCTAIVYITLGLVFLFFALGLWRRSRRVTVAWCITVSALAAVWLLLFLLQPLPYGFQQIPFGEVAFLVALSVVSWLLCRSHHHAKPI